MCFNFNEYRWLIFFFFHISLFYRMIFFGFNLSSFCSHSLSASVFSFIPHPWNECDLWELHARALISGCDGAFHKWQNGDKEWHEGRELARCPCDIFAHVDAAGHHDVFFLPDTYREAQQSALNLTPCIGRNVLCVRLPPRFIRRLAELRGRLWRDFLKIGWGGQWSRLNLIYSIWECHTLFWWPFAGREKLKWDTQGSLWVNPEM